MGQPRMRHRPWPVTVFLTLVGLTACSSGGADDPPTGVPVTPSGSATHVREAKTPAPSSSEVPPDLTTARFQLPMENILCEFFPDSSLLICGIESGLVPEPPAKYCAAEWVGISIKVNELASPACTGDWELEPEPATVLQYEETWSLGGVTCLSESTGITCSDERDNGFTLAKAGWSLLGEEDAATAAFGELRSAVRKEERTDLPGQVATVPRPILGENGSCGELQDAIVQTKLTDGRTSVYTACYVTGTWYIETGPVFPD